MTAALPRRRPVLGLRFRVAAGVLALAIVAAVAVAVAATAEDAPASPAVVPATAHPAGAGAAFRLSSIMGGPAVSLQEAAGRPVLLSFFASWCDSCRQELATVSALARAAGRRVAVIGIDVNDTDGPARAIVAADHIAYPVGADRHGRIANQYGLIGLPTTVYLDSQHRIVGRTVGPVTMGVGEGWLDALEAPTS